MSEANVTFVGLPDGNAPRGTNAVREIGSRIAGIASAAGSRTIFASRRYDTHLDPVATYRYAEAAARAIGAKLYAYPVWGLMLPANASLPHTCLTGFSLPVGRHLQTKRDAVFAHRSQTSRLITDAVSAFQLNLEQLEVLITGTERYIVELP